MKRRIYGIVTLLVSCIALAAATAHAQSGTTLKAHIPFAFTIGKTILPAGDYRIEIANHATGNNVLRVRSVDNRTDMMMIPSSIHPRTTPEIQLVFNNYGGARFLSQIQTSDYQLTLHKSRAERDLQHRSAHDTKGAMTARVTPETIVIKLVAAE